MEGACGESAGPSLELRGCHMAVSGPALSTEGICLDEAVPLCRGVRCPGS